MTNMKARLFYMCKVYATFLMFFILQKIIFTYVNAAASAWPLTIGDMAQVIIHGLGLDLSTTGYLSAIPFLVVWAGMWLPHLNHKTVLAPYFILVSLLISLICVGDTSLYAFWQFKLDATIFNYLDAPKQALASVSTFYIVIRLLLICAFAALLSWFFVWLTPRHFPKLVGGWQKTACNGMHILLGGLIFLAIRGGVGRSTMNVGSAYFSENNYLNHAAINPAFSLLYSYFKSEDFAEKYNYLDAETLAKTYATLYPAQTEDCTDTLLNTRRPNVLIIVLEGFGGYYVEELGGVKDVTPQMSRLIKEGIFFDNVYANSFRTDRGLVSALSGHISYPTTSIMKMPAKSGRLPGIARTLRANGYHTDFLYGGDINFTNMRSYFTTTGYQQLTSDTDFSLAERTSSSWGAHDEYAFDKLYKMIKARPENELWHTGFLTLSSHEPFEVPYNRLEDKRLNSFAYTDHCLGKFIDDLKKLPVWDNLLIVCIPDHGSSPTFNTTSPDFYHVPMLWLGGAIRQARVVHTLMNQSDMPATLLGQLGLPHTDFSYSRNIFSEAYTYPFAYSTYNDGFLFKDSTGVTIYDNAAQKVVSTAPETGTETREQKGKSILQTSYDELGKP